MWNFLKKKNWLVFSILALLCSVVPVQAKTLKILSSWPEHMIFVKGSIEPFTSNLKEYAKGGLEIDYFGPEVIPAIEQLQPVQAGVFDLLYTISAYHMGTTAIGAAVDAIAPGPERLRKTGIFDYIDKEYNKLGLKLIAIVPITDLHFLMRVPIDNKKPSFAGLKIRTIGTVVPLVESMGGAPVNMPSGEVFTSLQKGVIDGTTLITFGAIEFKLHEVTKYVVRPTFGFMSTLLLMNLDKYNGLSPADKDALDKSGAKTELDSANFFKDKKAEEEKELQRLGLKETHMAAEDAARADRVYRETIWKMTKEKSGESVEKLYELAKSQGLTE